LDEQGFANTRAAGGKGFMGRLERAAELVRKVLNEQVFPDTTVERYPAIKTLSNVTGSEDFSYGVVQLLNCYIVRKTAPWMFDKTGEIQGGDAELLVKSNQAIFKNDKIVWNGNTYIVQDVLARDQLAGVVYKRCNLFFVS
jgi:hypothetical protein